VTIVTRLALADFLERVRRSSFLVILALAAFLGYQVINGLFILRLGSYRGEYNAAWIGTLMALTLSFFLFLIGFYLVRGNVQHDRHTGVGQILAASPMRKLTYVFGKFASNTAVLLVIAGVLALAALAMLLIHGEDKTLNLYQLWMPFLVFSVPVALLVAATAVVFECTPVLREATGNVIYFFLWVVMLPLFGVNLMGFDTIEQGMATALQAQGADYHGGIVLGATAVTELQTFQWDGFDWATVAGPRLLYVAAALLLAALAALPFERFDTARGRIRSSRPSRIAAWRRRLADRFFASNAIVSRTPTPTITGVTQARASGSTLSLFVQVVAAEFKLLLKGRPLLWYAGAVAWILACLLLPLDVARRWLLPVVWLWPLSLWSAMGARETRYLVSPLLLSAPSPLWRQLPATWAAGVLLSLLMGSGALLRFLAEPALLPGFVAGALFIPSLALLLGLATGAERPFQVVLLLLWYLGPVNGIAFFDYTGATEEALALGMPWMYLSLSAAMLAAAHGLRWRQVR
jgi:ABC-type transport system involved in multi-copper enzyme maturation permease subunit